MASCNFCGKAIETSRPMVLTGNICFIANAGNGRAWVGQAPSVRYWKTFALLSIGLCPECVSKEKDKFINKLLHLNPAPPKLALHHYLKTMIIPKRDILAISGQINGEEIKDINMKDTMMVQNPYDPYLSKNFNWSNFYELKLYAENDLDLIGKVKSAVAGDAWNHAPNRGLDEARLDARALFKK